MVRCAIANWKGGPGAGEGTVSTSSGVVSNVSYSFGWSSGNEPCSSPCEMLAAALASCMSLMIAQEMAGLGLKFEDVRTEALLKLEEKNDKWTIDSIDLRVSTKSPDVNARKFEIAGKKAKSRCPISRALDIPIRLIIEPPLRSLEKVA